MDSFFNGALAASLSILVTNPFDVVKSRMQVANESLSKNVDVRPNNPAYRNVFSALRYIVKMEGPIGLYRGLVPAIMFQAVGNSFRFGVYHTGKRLSGVDADGQMSLTLNLLCALCAGVTAGVVACPFFILKTQFQIATPVASLATGFQHSYDGGLVPALRAIYRRSGWRGFFRGVDAFVGRVTCLVTAQLTTYDLAKHKLVGVPFPTVEMVDGRPRVLRRPLEGAPVHFLSSALASVVATLAMQPLDLVSSRLMNQPVSYDGIGTYYTSAGDCVRKTVSAEGWRGLYRGGLANWLRVCPQYILTFMLFEQFSKVTGRWRERRAAAAALGSADDDGLLPVR
eukprot:TRINITY_DN7015_c0_g1_i1.p1 TRINITY_DN7015_c0_g1~~TRINITY_DN7015_c0_g1_i1.p1  ORF type:complete len:341 (+),score=54.95 TRINITY_DN7015_c0_g1_i1:58-1080(+)